MIDVAVSRIQERIQSTLPFFDVVGGVARPQKIRVGDIVKTLPATPDPDNQGAYIWLTPDSGKSAMVYFEALSNKPAQPLAGGAGFLYETRLRAVAWLNTKRLSANDPGAVMAALVSKITGRYDDDYPVASIILLPEAEAIRGPELFGKYTYDETETQFLMLPFEYFAFDFNLRFAIISNCIVENVLKVDPAC